MTPRAPDRVVVWFARTSGRWYWSREAPNGRQIAASGEGYSRRWAAKRAAKRVQRADLRSGAAVLVLRDRTEGRGR